MDKAFTVVVVDDESDSRALLAETLEEAHYHVMQFGNGALALEAIQKIQGPFLILLDWQMPVMGGEEFLARKAQLDCSARRAPVIILSGMVGKAEEIPDVVGRMAKPFNVATLVETIKIYSRFHQPA
jgi:two-component system cell cycle response regulator CpdR